MSLTCRCLLLLITLICCVNVHANKASSRHDSIDPSTQQNYSLLAPDGSTWLIGIRAYKGTLAMVRPDIKDPFSFINDDQVGSNFSTGANWHAHGDVTFRVRNPDRSGDEYVQYSTVDDAGGPAISIQPRSVDGVAAFDVTPLINPGHGLKIEREWAIPSLATSGDQKSDPYNKLRMAIRITNTASHRIELGAFGVSALFSSNWNNMDLKQAAAHCSLAEPFIGASHGFVKVARLTGTGGVLLVTPVLGHATNQSIYQSSIAAWRHLKQEDLTQTGYAFEGHYEMMALTEAWQTNEWESVNRSLAWTNPQSRILNPNQTIHFAYEYQMVQDVRSVDNYLVEQSRINIRAVPGYVLAMEKTETNFDQALYIHVPSTITHLTINHTGEGRVELTEDRSVDKYRRWIITPRHVGRAKVEFRFTHQNNDKTFESETFINFNVLPSFASQLERLGQFTEKRQFFTDETDPFGRAFSVMPFDFEADALIMQDSRSYVVGLSDEAGAGPGLAYISKNRFWPVQSQIDDLDLYINRTLWGVKSSSIPFPVSVQNSNHSIHASLFWYPGMPDYKYTVNDGWDQVRGSQLWRSYNYVHPTVLYHSIYRLARDNDKLKTLYSSNWYLMQAYYTFVAMFDNAPYYTQFGLMEGSVFLDLMRDLELEGLTTEFKDMQQREQARANTWQQLPFPFGSEMPWDSTGQEELLMTSHQFGMFDLSNRSLSAILAYTHSIPSWAYHGAARRFWDHWINGSPKYTMAWPERDLHHYGSSLNGKPLLYAYEATPDDTYLLEVGLGSMTGVLTNIQLSGASSMSFHADNGLLKHDPFDADYGCALYGHVTSSSSYFVQHPQFGPTCYLCHSNTTDKGVIIEPRDSLRTRLYIEPIGALLEMETGHISNVKLNLKSQNMEITFDVDKLPLFSQYRVKISHPAPCNQRPGCDIHVTAPPSKLVRGAYVFDVSQRTITLAWGSGSTKIASE